MLIDFISLIDDRRKDGYFTLGTHCFAFNIILNERASEPIQFSLIWPPLTQVSDSLLHALRDPFPYLALVCDMTISLMALSGYRA